MSSNKYLKILNSNENQKRAIINFFRVDITLNGNLILISAIKLSIVNDGAKINYDLLKDITCILYL